ncbi:MAG: metallophosphoesterase [Oligoflexia bacterium]|nr:metallophosphoesterase [Oligoflexia bacterium]
MTDGKCIFTESGLCLNKKIQRLTNILMSLFILVGLMLLVVSCHISNTDTTNGIHTDNTLASESLEIDSKKYFSIITLPDTQKFIHFKPEIFEKQIRWIINNRKKLNIKHVIHLGDIVDEDEDISMWETADKIFTLLDEAKIPYSIAIGNHDYSMGSGAPVSQYLVREKSNYSKYFPSTRFSRLSTNAMHSYDAYNNYQIINFGNAKLMVFALELYPRDRVLTWVKDILTEYSDYKAVIGTHAFLELDGTLIRDIEFIDENQQVIDGKPPSIIWEKISKFENIVGILCGHRINSQGFGSFIKSVQGPKGNRVVHLLSDYQNILDLNNPLVGSINILIFDNDLRILKVKTFSPITGNLSNSYSLIGDSESL